MTLLGRLDKIERALGPDPNARPLALFIMEDEAGRWWHNDEEITREDVEARSPQLLHISRLIQLADRTTATDDEREPA
jgi:hypothetical protein